MEQSQNGQFKELIERLGLHQSLVSVVISTLGQRFKTDAQIVIGVLLNAAKILSGELQAIYVSPVEVASPVRNFIDRTYLLHLVDRWRDDLVRISQATAECESLGTSFGLRCESSGVRRCRDQLLLLLGMTLDERSWEDAIPLLEDHGLSFVELDKQLGRWAEAVKRLEERAKSFEEPGPNHSLNAADTCRGQALGIGTCQNDLELPMATNRPPVRQTMPTEGGS